MSELITPRIKDIPSKTLKEVGWRPFRSGTFEFIYETGDTAAKIVNVLSDPARYTLSGIELHPLSVDNKTYVVEKREVYRAGDERGKKLAELEVKRDTEGNIHGVFLGMSSVECRIVAELIRSG
ncbi:MAG: hypothetical protein AB1324_02075 [Candidatus Micrarchaeota archaeon]